MINYEAKSSVWEVRHHDSPSSVLATVNASYGTYLLGPFQWTFEGDSKRWAVNIASNADNSNQVCLILLSLDVSHWLQRQRVCLQGWQLRADGGEVRW